MKKKIVVVLAADFQQQRSVRTINTGYYNTIPKFIIIRHII